MMNRRPETLGDFVRRIRKEKNLSLADVSEQSSRFGQRITAGYISRIENDPKRRITTDRATALANGLGVPVRELLDRAVGEVVPGGESEEEVHLLTRFKQLPPDRRADVLNIVNMWYSEYSRRTSRRRSAYSENKQTVQ